MVTSMDMKVRNVVKKAHIDSINISLVMNQKITKRFEENVIESADGGIPLDLWRHSYSGWECMGM